MSLIVKGKLLTPKGIIDGSLLIDGGLITKVAHGDLGEPAEEVLDYRGRPGVVVLPGLVDMHVHLRDFDLSYKEDFLSGTRSAAKGGFTVVADMPNTKPRTNTPGAIEAKDRLARAKAIVDYGLYYGVPDDPGDLADDICRLAVGIKIYAQDELYSEKRPLAEAAFNYAARAGLPVVAHAENPAFFTRTDRGVARPSKAEASAIEDLSAYALERGFRLHITHISSAEGLAAWRNGRGDVGSTADASPCHLILTEGHARKLGGFAQVDPPIRGAHDRRALLEAVRDGTIDAIASDHAPHTVEEKLGVAGEIPRGVPGLETTIPLLLNMVNDGLMTLGRLVELCSAGPSRILGIRGAGAIEEGRIGNLTVVDLRREVVVDPRGFESKARHSPFAGWRVRGAPIATVVRGRPVMLEGQVLESKGWGVNVKTYH